jgi:hypothetical protein
MVSLRVPLLVLVLLMSSCVLNRVPHKAQRMPDPGTLSFTVEYGCRPRRRAFQGYHPLCRLYHHYLWAGREAPVETEDVVVLPVAVPE